MKILFRIEDLPESPSVHLAECFELELSPGSGDFRTLVPIFALSLGGF